jgi:hypothetical protein
MNARLVPQVYAAQLGWCVIPGDKGFPVLFEAFGPDAREDCVRWAQQSNVAIDEPYPTQSGRCR